MGLISEILNFLSDVSNDTYLNHSKEWADEIWDSMRNKRRATLYLAEVEGRLYKHLRIRFRDNVTAVFSEDDDRGCSSKYDLTKQQLRELKNEGRIVIKKYD